MPVATQQFTRWCAGANLGQLKVRLPRSSAVGSAIIGWNCGYVELNVGCCHASNGSQTSRCNQLLASEHDFVEDDSGSQRLVDGAVLGDVLKAFSDGIIKIAIDEDA